VYNPMLIYLLVLQVMCFMDDTFKWLLQTDKGVVLLIERDLWQDLPHLYSCVQASESHSLG
jgi:hypothetical protein